MTPSKPVKRLIDHPPAAQAGPPAGGDVSEDVLEEGPSRLRPGGGPKKKGQKDKGLKPRFAGQGGGPGKAVASGQAARPGKPPGAGPADGAATSPDVVQSTEVYKTTARGALRIDIYKPRGAAPAGGWPCVVFFHGGAWWRGAPRQFRGFCTQLAERGVVGMSAAYRLLAEGEDAIPHDALCDARSAMRWVRANAARLGLDPARIAAGGGSAGGTLAVMTALKAPVDDPKDDLAVDPRPAALLLLNPPLNFDGYATSVPLEQRRRLSPLHLLDATLPPTLMLQGTHDRIVPHAEAVAFRDRGRELGVKDFTLISYEGRKHGFFNPGRGDGDFEAAVANMADFLRRLGWLPGRAAA